MHPMRNFLERKISSCLVTFIGRVNANDGVLFLFPKAIIALLSLIDYTGIITFFDAKRNQVAFLFTDCTHSSFLKTHAPIPPTAHAVGFLGAGSLNHARQFNVVAGFEPAWPAWKAGVLTPIRCLHEKKRVNPLLAPPWCPFSRSSSPKHHLYVS